MNLKGKIKYSCRSGIQTPVQVDKYPTLALIGYHISSINTTPLNSTTVGINRVQTTLTLKEILIVVHPQIVPYVVIVKSIIYMYCISILFNNDLHLGNGSLS